MGHWSCQRRLAFGQLSHTQTITAAKGAFSLHKASCDCCRGGVFSSRTDSTWPLMHLKIVVLCKDLIYYLCTLVLSWLVGDTFGWLKFKCYQHVLTIFVWLNRVNHQLFFEVLMLLIPTVEVENCYLCFQRLYSHGVVSRPPKSADPPEIKSFPSKRESSVGFRIMEL